MGFSGIVNERRRVDNWVAFFYLQQPIESHSSIVLWTLVMSSSVLIYVLRVAATISNSSDLVVLRYWIILTRNSIQTTLVR